MHLSSVRSFLTLGCAARLRPVIAAEPERLTGFAALLRDIGSRAAPDVDQMTSTFTRGHYGMERAIQRAAQAGACVQAVERPVHHDPSSRGPNFKLKAIDHTPGRHALTFEAGSALKDFRLQERPLPKAQASAGTDNDSRAHVGPFVVPKAVLDILRLKPEEHNDVIRQRAGLMEAHPPGDLPATSHSRPATPLFRQGSSTSFGTTNSSGTVNSRKAITEAYAPDMLRSPASAANQAGMGGHSPVIPPYPKSDSDDDPIVRRPPVAMARAPGNRTTGVPVAPLKELQSLSQAQYRYLMDQVDAPDREQVLGQLRLFEDELGRMFENYVCFSGERDKKALERLIATAKSSLAERDATGGRNYVSELSETTNTMTQYYRDENERIISAEQHVIRKVMARQLETLASLLEAQRANIKDMKQFDGIAPLLLNRLVSSFAQILAPGVDRGIKYNGVQADATKTLRAEAEMILAECRASLARQFAAEDARTQSNATATTGYTGRVQSTVPARWPRLHQAWQWVKTRAVLGSAAGSLG